MDTLVVTENTTVTTVIVTEEHTAFVVEDKPYVLTVSPETVVVSEVPIQNPTVLVYPNETVHTVVLKEVGPQGPPGTSNVDLDKMTNPDYAVSRKILIFNNLQILVGIDVYSGLTGGVLLFQRMIEYDGDGRVSTVQTDDMLNDSRLTKTMTYNVDGELVDITREITTWQ